MRALYAGWGLAVIVAMLLKLFTYEFYLADDPTCGVAIRSSASLVSKQLLQQSGVERDYILLQDENGFLGEGLYRSIVGWGWIAFPVVLALFMIARRVKYIFRPSGL